MNAKRELRLLLLCAVVIAAGVVGVSSATAKTITGTASNDTLRGTPAADVIYGRAGNDTLYGLGGNDRIVGGPGTDTISCGSGQDTVVADSSDRVAKDCESVTVPGVTCNIDIKQCICSDGKSHPISWCKKRHCGR